MKYLIFFIFASIWGQNLTVLPPIIPTCSRNSPRLADCVKQAIESLRPQIKAGAIQPYFTFQDKLIPLVISDVTIQRNFYLKMQDLKLYGIGEFKIEKLRINLENFKLEMLITIPKIEGGSRYSLKWIISLLNLQGSGDSNFFLENVKVLLKLSGSRYKNNNNNRLEYLRIDKCEVKVKSVARSRIYFNDIFKGNKALEVTANEVINANLDSFLTDIYPTIEQVLSQRLFTISNQVFSLATFDEFFPLK